MEPETPAAPQAETGVEAITVRYWASARAAAGVESELVAASSPLSLAALVRLLVSRHPGSSLESVLGVCSVLVGERPAGTADRADFLVTPGDQVEFLPPFAGG